MVNMLLRRRRKEADDAQDEASTTPKPREPTARSNEEVDTASVEHSEAEKVEAAREDFANGRWRHTSWAADNSADWETEGTIAFEAREGAKACGICLRTTCVVS